MAQPIERALLQHASALRALARDLVGADAADDVLQDTALQALQRPPRREGELRGWLVRIAQRLALRRRRGDRRRQRHEAAAAPAPAPRDPAADIEHRDAIRAVTDALLALPPLYQRALLLRYFEDLPPAAIAARTGDGVATVKSRLARGLSMLREALDADGARRDRRAGLTALAGLRTAPQAGVAVSTTGVVLMGTGVKLLAGGAAAALAVIVWWPKAPSPAAPSTAPFLDHRAPATQPAAAAAAANPAGEGKRIELAEAAPAPLALATVHGRCVDDRGDRLPGVEVALVNSTQGAAAQDPPVAPLLQTTAADGAFRFALQPLSDSRMLLRFSRAGCCPLRGEVRDLLPGADADVGDVVLPAAIFVRGHVRDTEGRPVGGATVSAWNAAATRPRMFPEGQANSVTAGDGSFGPLGPLPPGEGFATVVDRRLLQPVPRLQLEPSVPLVELEIVVRSDREVPPIRGFVVDGRGAPVAGAMVAFLDTRAGGVETAGDGSFTLHAGDSLAGAGPFALRVAKDGYSTVHTRPIALGSAEERIVLARARDLIVRARERGGAAPVAAFALDLVPLVPQCRVRQLDAADWPGGAARVPAVEPGPYLLHVAPGDAGLQPSGFVPVEVTAAQDTEVTVEVGRGHRKLLRLRDGSGAAVGAEVELIDPYGQQVRLDSRVLSLADCIRMLGPEPLLLLQEGRTDARGELRLDGPAGRDLALRIRGSEIAPQIVAPVRFDDDAPLELTVLRGAVWTGRVVPASVAAALLDAVPPLTSRGRTVGIELQRDGAALRRRGDPLSAFARDGSFRIAGIPPGTWQVMVHALGEPRWIASLTLREGEALERDLDLHRLQPCNVDLQVFVDGAPWAKQRLMVQVDHGAADAEHALGESVDVLESDAQGHVRWLSLPGRLGCRVWIRDGASAFHVLPPPVQIPIAERFEHVLDLHTSRLQLRVLRPDGSPAAGAGVQMTGLGWSEIELKLDADGRRSVPVLQGRHRLRAWPRRLARPAAREAFARENGDAALAAARLDLGEVDVGGRAATCEIRLPPAWDR